MNYTYDEFNIKLTLNPSDLIIRIEHRTTKCLYESTFTEDNFEGSKSIGGLKAIIKLIEKGLTKTYDDDETNDVTIRIVEGYGEGNQGLLMTIQYNNIIELRYTITIEPKRREINEAEIALETFREEIEIVKEEIAASMKHELKSIYSTVERLRRLIEPVILIPGYPVVVGDLKTLTLVSAVPEEPKENTFCVKSPTDVLSQYNDKPQAAKHINMLHINHTTQIQFPLIVCFRNLIHLKICHPFITDISWIDKLQELLEVDFEGCTGLFNIKPLSKLTRLYLINIKDTAVKDISKLEFTSGITIKR